MLPLIVWRAGRQVPFQLLTAFVAEKSPSPAVTRILVLSWRKHQDILGLACYQSPGPGPNYPGVGAKLETR